jgi:hypothetical protein
MTEPLSHPSSIAIVGAGIAGLACAATLLDAGHRVTLFDKGRSAGGRVATRRASRRADGPGASFDHGAQFATGRGAGFAALLARLQDEGAVAPWPAAQRGRDPVFTGVPGMSALPHAMAERIKAKGGVILAERHVAWLHDGGVLRHLPASEATPGSTQDHGGEVTGAFDAVLLAVPAPQAGPLLATRGSRFASGLRDVVIAPCWAVMATFVAPVVAADVIRPEGSPLGWIARNSARPGHAATPDAWVLHASAAWSRAHLEDSAEAVIPALMQAFEAVVGSSLPAATSVVGHRWRFALVETPLGQPCLWDASEAIGVCGDWCLGPRVEAAYDSGIALATEVLAHAGLGQ